jgi:hypothetical protein
MKTVALDPGCNCCRDICSITSVSFRSLLRSHVEWQTAKVVKADFARTATEAVAVPLPGGGAVDESSTSSGKHAQGLYWLKTDKYTYGAPNYCKSNAPMRRT